MKKLFSSLFIVMMIALAFTVVASAAEVYKADADGLYNIEYEIDAEDGTQFGMVVIEAAEDAAFALDEATIRYIDQVAAEDGAITFDAFAPMDLKNEGTYKVYIGGGDLDEATLIGTLSTEVVEEPTPDEPKPEDPTVIKGDIDGSKVVDSDDAIYLLLYTFDDSMEVFANTDVDGSGVTDSDDAIYLLLYTFDDSMELH